MKMKRQEESLFLSELKLNDENIKYLSLIKFNQLKEIDLSENEIIDIEPLCNMNLPFLEFLNLSYNKIKNIEPLGEIYLNNLKYLFIQNNIIQNIDVLLDPEFPTLEILRLENNKIFEDSQSFRKLLVLYNNYKNILISNTAQIDGIRNKLNINNEKTIEVGGTAEGDLILKYILIIISSNNKIRKLNLSGNKIEDPSTLNRIIFHFLEELDLSFNNIKNMKFLKGMKAKDLKRLYLDNNYINDLSPLYNIRKYFPHLEVITLENNNFYPDESEYEYLPSGIKFQTSDERTNNYLNVKCFYCNRISKENKNIYLYCYDCKTEFCRKCEIKHRENKNIHTKIIKVNEKNNRSLENYDKELYLS